MYSITGSQIFYADFNFSTKMKRYTAYRKTINNTHKLSGILSGNDTLSTTCDRYSLSVLEVLAVAEICVHTRHAIYFNNNYSYFFCMIQG